MESNVNKTAHYKWTRVVLVDAGQLWGQSQGWVNNKLDSSEPVSDETVQEWLDAWWREEGVIERGVCHSSSLKAVVVSRLTLRLSCALSSIYVSLSALCVKYQTCLDRETHQLTAGFVFPLMRFQKRWTQSCSYEIDMFSEPDYKLQVCFDRIVDRGNKIWIINCAKLG